MAISPRTTLIDHLVPVRVSSRASGLARDSLLVVASSILIALCARLQITLPFTPVPITLQPLAVVLVGAALGSRRGALAMLLYIAEGAAGLPVFAKGGGFIYLLGPTAGYIWSFPLAAFVVGWLCERGLDRSFLTSILAMLPGSLIIYLIGVPWLAFGFLRGNMAVAFMQGMLPFVVGDLLKLVAAAILLPTAWAIVRAIKPGKES